MNSNEHVLLLTPGVPLDAHFDAPRMMPGLADTALAAPLFVGQSLAPGEGRLSPNGSHLLVYQRDGNLVLYRVSDKKALWASGTNGKATTRVTLSDKKLEIEGVMTLWSSAGSLATALLVGDSGEVQLLGASGALWQKGTLGAWSGPTRLLPATLAAGAEIKRGDALVAANGRYALWYRPAGDLAVVRLGNGQVLARTDTDGQGRASFQADGNLVLYVTENNVERPAWSSDTYNKGATELTIGGDGVVRIFDKDRGVLWSGATARTVVSSGLRFGASEAAFPATSELPPWVADGRRAPLLVGGALALANAALLSPDGSHALVYEKAGDLVLYRVADKARLWSSYTSGKTFGKLTLQADGNLVLYDAASKPVWSSATNGKRAAALMLADSGELRLLGPEGKLWGAGPAHLQWTGPARLFTALPRGGELQSNDALLAPGGDFALWLRGSELVVVRLSTGAIAWRPLKYGTRLAMQTDGNLVLYDNSGQASWAAGSNGAGVLRVEVTDAGVARVMNDKGVAVWSTPQPLATGGAACVRLPEMVVSYAHGLTIQARIRGAVDGTILALGNGESPDLIHLERRSNQLALVWNSKTVLGGSLPQAGWSDVAVALSAGEVRFYLDGVLQQTVAHSHGLPAEKARALNAIGRSHRVSDAFSGSIADVRLWNRALPGGRIAATTPTSLLGYEPGLSGWWTLTGAEGVRDRSPFGRHGALVGPAAAGPEPFALFAAEDRTAIDVGDGNILVDSFMLDGNGFTGQVHARPRGFPCEAILIEVTEGVAHAHLGVETSGALFYSVTRDGVTRRTTFSAKLKVGVWSALCVRQGVDGEVSLFVDGVKVGSAAGIVLPGVRYTARAGLNFAGALAELRIWSRMLSTAEIVDTTPRRIHGWAPGLVGCWRLDEVKLDDERSLLNADPTGPAASRIFWNVAPSVVDRGTLAFAAPPLVAPPRVARVDWLGLPAVALPGAGFSLQAWLNLDTLEDRQLLAWTGRGTTASQLKLSMTSRGDLVVGLWRAKNGPQDVNRQFDGVVTARRWVHVTLTCDARGFLCVYRDGRLVARHQGVTLAANDLYDGELGSLSVTELRTWSRALSESEVAANWRRRLASATGLVGRWALAGDLSGAPGPAHGMLSWREAPSLALQDGTPPTYAAAAARVGIFSQDGRTFMSVDFTATDAQGAPAPGVDVTLVLCYPSQPASRPEEEVPRITKLYRDRTGDDKRLGLSPGDRPSTTAKTDARGALRVVFELKGLATPVLRVRHAGMGEGEWSLVAPDQTIHRTLATLTPNELLYGRRGSAEHKPGAGGLVQSGAEELSDMLGAMLGAAADFSFEEESTAALAFDGEQPPPPPPLVPVASGRRGTTFRIGDDAPLTRRLGRPGVGLADEEAPVPAGEVGPESFADFSWLKRGVKVIARFADAAVSATLDTVESIGRGVAAVGQAVLTSLEVAADAVINGVKIIKTWVVQTVEQMVAAVHDLMNLLGKALSTVTSFLSQVFDWDDIRETAEVMYTSLDAALLSARVAAAGLFDRCEEGLREVESSILQLLGGDSSVPAVTCDEVNAVEKDEPPELPGMLDWLLSLLPDSIETTLRDLLGVFDPLADLIGDLGTRLPGLVAGVSQEFNDPALVAAFNEPRKFFDKDLSEWRIFARILVKLVANVGATVIDLVGDLFDAVLHSFQKFLAVRVNIPYLTPYVEANVLGGKQLTVGRALCLALAIPITISYKLLSGAERGPFARVDGPIAFAEEEEPGKGGEIFARVIGSGAALYGGILDTIGAADDDAFKKNFGWLVPKALLDLTQTVTDIVFFKDIEWAGQNGWMRAGTVLGVVATTIGGVGLICDGVSLALRFKGKGSDADKWDTASGIIGAVGDGAGLVAGVCNIVGTQKESSTTPKIDVALAWLDGVGSIASFVASLFGAIDVDDATYKAVRVYLIGGGNAVNFGCAICGMVLFCVADGGPRAAVLFTDPNFNGAEKEFTIGQFDYGELVGNVGNDAASSLRVAEGHRVTLYEHGAFGGRSRTFDPGEYPGLGDFNDLVSSLKVERT